MLLFLLLTVSSVNSASINTEASGVVTKVYVQNGQKVRSGDKIAELDLDQPSQQKYSQAVASYQGAQSNLESAKINIWSLQSKEFAANQKFINDAAARDLATNDPTYIQQNADWLAASYNNGQKGITQAQNSLNSAWISLKLVSPTIYAPVSGIVTGLSLDTGTVITTSSSSTTSTSQKVGNVVTGASPTILINLTEVDVPKVKIGNKVTVTFDAIPGKTFTGKVVSVDTVGAVSSGVTTYPAVIKLDTTPEGILSNMSAQASIITNTKDNVIIAPSSAVQTQNEQKYVCFKRW